MNNLTKPILITLPLLTLLIVGQAFAQKDTQALSSLQTSVESTTEKVAELRAAMEQGKIDAQNAGAEIDALISELHGIKQNVGEDSDIWKDMDAMMGTFKHARGKAEKELKDPNEDNTFWADSVKEWDEKISRIGLLKDQILQTANDIDRKAEFLDSRRDMIVDTLLRGYAEKAKQLLEEALEALNDTNESLTQLMKAYTDTTKEPHTR